MDEPYSLLLVLIDSLAVHLVGSSQASLVSKILESDGDEMDKRHNASEKDPWCLTQSQARK